MSKPDTIDEILKRLIAGAMEYQNPKSVTAFGSSIAIGPETAKAALSAMMAEIIGEDVNAIERNSYAQITKYDEVADHQNELRAEQRQRAIDMGFTL